MAERELKTVLGFEAGQAISTLATLTASLQGYNAAIRSAAFGTSKFNKAAASTDAALKTLSTGSNISGRSIKALSAKIKELEANQKKLVTQVEKLRKKLQETGNQGAKSGKQMMLSWQSVARIFAIQVIHQAISKVTSALTNSVGEAIKLELVLAEIQTIAPSLRNDFEGVADSVQRLSNQFGISREIVAEGVYQTLSNQVAEGSEAFEFFAAAANLSVGAVMEADAAVNLLSSVINSYGYEASQAAVISGKLFKTIEMGRVRGEEFANTYGRILVLASQLGAAFDEVNTSVATLTVTGLKYNEAATLITNTMLKLIKPTDTMKAAYEALGVPTAEVGIQAFGFQGFLDELRKTTAGTSAELGELFGRVRAIRGVMGLTGRATKRYQKILEAMAESGAKDIFEARELIFKTNAKQVEIEIQSLKNAIVFDFGRKAVAAILAVSNAFGGLENVYTGLTVAVGAAAVSIGVLAAMAFPIAAAVVATAAAVGLLTTMTLNSHESSAKALTDRMRKAKKTQDEMAADAGELAELQIRLDNKVLAEYQKNNAKYAILNSKRMKNAIGKEEYLTDIFSDQLSDRLTIYKTFVDLIEDRSKEATEAIIDSQKRIFDINREIGKLQFERAVEGVDPRRKSWAAVQESGKLLRRASEAFRKGEFDMADDLHSDAKAMAKVAIQAGNVAKNRAAVWHGEKAQTAVLNQQISQQETFIKNEQTAARLADSEVAAEKSRFDRIAQHFKEMQIEIFSEKGKLNYPTAEDAKKAIAPSMAAVEKEMAELLEKAPSFEKMGLMKNFRELMKPFEDLMTRRPIDLRFAVEENFIDEVFRNLQDEANDNEVIVRVAFEALTGEKVPKGVAARSFMAQRALEIQKANEEVKRKRVGLQGLFEKETTAAKNSSDAIKVLTKDYLEWKKAAQRVIMAVYKEDKAGRALPMRRFPGEDSKKLLAEYKARQAFFNEAYQSMQQLSTATKELDPQKVGEYATVIGDLARKADVAGLTDMAEALRASVTASKELVRTRMDIQAIPSKGVGALLIEHFKQANEAEKELKNKAKETNDTVSTDLSSAVGFGTSAVVAAVTTQVSAWDGAISKVKEYGTLVAALANTAPTVISTTTMQAAHYGKLMYRAAGGFAPRGTDTIPAMLSPGEFIMNAQSTRRFYAQLVAMNAGKTPIYRQQGGPVTNVGDVNITVSGASAPQQTARETMQAFRREMRRHTSTF